LFPALVALWFAVLLGGGSLILPAAMLERAVTMSGLPALFPPAAPPLGSTAHMLIVAAATLLGAALGLFLAWMVVRSHAGVKTRRLSDQSGIQAPPSRTEEEIEGRQAVAEASLRRRGLLAPANDARTDVWEEEFAGETPVEGPRPGSMRASFLSAQSRLSGDFAPPEPDMPGLYDEEPAVEPAALWLTQEDDDRGSAPMSALSHGLSLADPFDHDLEEWAGEDPAGDPHIDSPDHANSPEIAEVAPTIYETPVQSQPAVPVISEREPIDHLGMVHLVQRLAAALAEFRDFHAARYPAQPLASPAISTEIAAASDAREATAAFFSAQPPLPVDIAPAGALQRQSHIVQETRPRPSAVMAGRIGPHIGTARSPHADEALRAALATLRQMSGAA